MMQSEQSDATAKGNRVLVAELGRGGMATVYLVLVRGPGGFNKLQVEKRLHPELAADPEFVTMFLDEAKLAARISHPHVVQTLDVGRDGPHYRIVMEYLDGLSLETIVRRGEKATTDEARAKARIPLRMHLQVLAEVLAGLHYAHELTDFDGNPLNLVHRDVSPQNIIVTYGGHTKLVDFGIAKAADSSSQTRVGIVKGKSAYMAPEQFGGAKIDRRADVFAAGILMWQALTGRRLWKGLSEDEIFKRLATGEIPAPRSVNPDVPEELEKICMKALEHEREKRHATAAELQSEIEHYLAKGERVTHQQIGAWLCEQFADRRAKTKAIIETQVANAAKSGSISLAALSTTMSTGQHAPVANVAKADSGEVAPPPRWSTKTTWLAAAAVGLAVAAGLVWIGSTRKQPIAEAAPPAAPPPKEALVTIKVDTVPADAHVTIDGVPISSNPTTRPLDGIVHAVRAEAPGYLPRGEMVVFDTANLSVALSLEKEPTGGDPKAKRPPTAPAWQPVVNAKASPSAPPSAKTAPAASSAPPPPTTATPPKPAPPKPAPQDTSGLDTRDPWK